MSFRLRCSRLQWEIYGRRPFIEQIAVLKFSLVSVALAKFGDLENLAWDYYREK